MTRYLVIDWERQSLRFADSIKEFDDGGGCVYGDINDLIKNAETVIKAHKGEEDEQD